MTEPTPALAALPAHLGLAKTRDGLMLYFAHDQYIGRSLAVYGEYCQLEADALARMLQPGDVVVEAGANIGAHTVGLARQVGPTGRVHAFEPQRLVHQLLCANVALNGQTNTETHHAGLGEAAGVLGVPPMNYGQPGNFGGVSLSDSAEYERVPVATLDQLALPRLDLLKVDVEGMEAAVLKGGRDTLRRKRPILYVENDRPERAGALIDLMFELDYQLWWHTPPLFNPANPRGLQENIFPGLMALNVMGFPRERNVQIAGLKPITDRHTGWQS